MAQFYDRESQIPLHGYTHGKPGMPKKRWLDKIHEECKDLNLTTHEGIYTLSQ